MCRLIKSLSWTILLLLACENGAAQPFEAIGGAGLSEVSGQRLELRELPPCPSELQLVLDRGNVSFIVGGLRPSIIDQTRSTGDVDKRFDAETQFHLSYTFKSRCRWGFVQNQSRKRLMIDVDFDRLQLSVEHKVWFRKMPPRDSFWDLELVRHEFDHIRISSDARLQSLFEKKVGKRAAVTLSAEQTRPLLIEAEQMQRSSSAGRSRRSRNSTLLSYLGGSQAKSWVNEIVQKEFDAVVQMVEIRYAELDRITQHGRKPVPDGSELADWLGRDEAVE